MIDPRFTDAIENLYADLVHMERTAKIIDDAMALEGWADNDLRETRLDFEEAKNYISEALDYCGAILRREERIP